MLRLMVQPRVKANLLIYGFVPLGLAMVSAGLAELDRLYGERIDALDGLRADIAAEVGNLDALRRDRDVEAANAAEESVVEAELVEAAAR